MTAPDKYAKILWEYQYIKQDLKESDAIFVLGSQDIRTATYAAQLFLDNWAPLLICSGGIAHKGELTESPWDEPEATIFKKEAMRLGVPEEKIITETAATNTGENLLLTQKLLENKGLDLNTFILVQKPHALRRVHATQKQQWPDKECIVAAPDIAFEDYPTKIVPKDALINIMVGDLQRILTYPEKGFQITQDVPKDVLDAYNKLIALGYDKHLTK